MATRDFEIQARDRFAEATRSIVTSEIDTALNIAFLREIDLTQVERLRAEAAGTGRRKPSYSAFVVKALGKALRQFPYANRRFWRWPLGLGGRFQRFERVDVAVAVERDLKESHSAAFIDIVRDADRRSLEEIDEQLEALARADVTNNPQWAQFSSLIRRLPTWLSSRVIRLPVWTPELWTRYRGGSALISSPAKYGVDAVIGSWTHPVSVSFGLVERRPVVRGDAVVPAPTFMLTLSFDRSLMAGAQAARFFRCMCDHLTDAQSLVTSAAEAPEAPVRLAAAEG